MAGLDYFYDSQTRNYLKQILAVFHGFQYEYLLRDGTKALRQVPVRWGDPSRMASHILRNNSENVINSAPFMTVWIRNMAMNPNWRQDPSFTQKIKVYEQEYNEETQSYTGNPRKKIYC